MQLLKLQRLSLDRGIETQNVPIHWVNALQQLQRLSLDRGIETQRERTGRTGRGVLQRLSLDRGIETIAVGDTVAVVLVAKAVPRQRD